MRAWAFVFVFSLTVLPTASTLTVLRPTCSAEIEDFISTSSAANFQAIKNCYERASSCASQAREYIRDQSDQGLGPLLQCMTIDENFIAVSDKICVDEAILYEEEKSTNLYWSLHECLTGFPVLRLPLPITEENIFIVIEKYGPHFLADGEDAPTLRRGGPIFFDYDEQG